MLRACSNVIGVKILTWRHGFVMIAALLGALLGYIGVVASETALPARRLDELGLASMRQPMYAVIDSQRDWDKLWRLHTCQNGLEDPCIPGSRPGKPQPTIDFSREFLVAAYWGQKPYTSYDHHIDSVKVAHGTLVVNVRQTRPRRGLYCFFGCIDQPMAVQPYDIVAVPRSSLALGEYTVKFRALGLPILQTLLAIDKITIR